MKLIRKGILPSTIIWEGECRQCHSTFEITQGELELSSKIESDQRDPEPFAHYDCPECRAKRGNAIIFYKKKV